VIGKNGLSLQTECEITEPKFSESSKTTTTKQKNNLKRRLSAHTSEAWAMTVFSIQVVVVVDLGTCVFIVGCLPSVI